MKEKFVSETPNNKVSETPEPPKSIILAWSFGSVAPPTIAIISPAEPIFASSSDKSPFLVMSREERMTRFQMVT